jgi:hypothetical protein
MCGLSSRPLYSLVRSTRTKTSKLFPGIGRLLISALTGTCSGRVYSGRQKRNLDAQLHASALSASSWYSGIKTVAIVDAVEQGNHATSSVSFIHAAALEVPFLNTSVPFLYTLRTFHNVIQFSRLFNKIRFLQLNWITL